MPGIGYAFNGKNERAQTSAREYGARAVREVSAETRRAINLLVEQGIRDGIPPVRLARMVKANIGLTARQALSVARYEERMRRQGHKPSQVTKRTNAYRRKKMRERSRNIAQTETMGALNRGKLEAGYQAEANGLLDNPVKRWVVGMDERVCPKCGPMEDQRVPLNDAFSNGLHAPPAHPRCRCTISVVEGDPLSAYIPKELQLAQGPEVPPPPAVNLEPKDPIWKVDTYSEASRRRINALAHEMEKDYEILVRLMDRSELEKHLRNTHHVPLKYVAQYAEEMVEYALTVELEGLRQMRAKGVDLSHVKGSYVVQGWSGDSYAWAGRSKPSEWSVAQGDYISTNYDPSRHTGGKAATRQIHFQNLAAESYYFSAKERARFGLDAFPWESSSNLGGFFPLYHPKVHAAYVKKEVTTSSRDKSAPSNRARTPIHETGHLLHTYKWRSNASYVLKPEPTWTRVSWSAPQAGGFHHLFKDYEAAARRGDLGGDFQHATDVQLSALWDSNMGQISGYASTNPVEWVAEAFATLVDGTPLTRVQAWAYAALNGPWVQAWVYGALNGPVVP